jgi:hypothetical protein
LKNAAAERFRLRFLTRDERQGNRAWVAALPGIARLSIDPGPNLR